MTINTYKKARIAVTFCISAIMSIVVITGNVYLAIATVITGIAVMQVLKSKTKAVLLDERAITVSEKAARASYMVMTTILGLSAFVLTFVSQQGSAEYLSSLAIVFSYLTLFSLAVYVGAFYYFNRKFGGPDEK